MASVSLDAPVAPRGARVLVVDDHADIRDPVAAYLGRQGFDAVPAAGAAELRHALDHSHIDAIVLDVMLRDGNGIALCRQLSECNGPPVILLTACADQRDRLAGLDAGADDYVVKPFDPAELAARLRSVLRRISRSAAPVQRQPDPRLHFAGWVFEPVSRLLHGPDGARVELGEAEARLLGAFLAHAREVLSRDRLLDLTQRGEQYTFDRSIDVQVCRLRKRLAGAPGVALIRTVRGGGYLFTAAVETLTA